MLLSRRSFLLSVPAAVALADDALPSSPYLDAAIEAAHWLATLERRIGRGIAWPTWAGAGSYYATGLDIGAAGIGTFFRRLYQVTRDPAWLDKCRGAADYIRGEYIANRVAGPDWLDGAGGVGEYLLDLAEQTGDTTYVGDAQIAGDYLVRTASADAEGYHWKFTSTPNLYTGLAHGGGGLAYFLIRLYQATGVEVYREYAEGAIAWLRQWMVRYSDSAIGFKRLTTDSAAYHGWCGGGTGLYFVFKRMLAVTGKDQYRDLMQQTANGLLASAIPVCPNDRRVPADGCADDAPSNLAWTYTTPGSGSYPVIVCHGTAGMSSALYAEWQRTGDRAFLDGARAGARWLFSVGQQTPAGLRWEHIDHSALIESGLLTGAASAGHAFVRFWRYETQRDDPDPDRGAAALEMAKAAAGFLLDFATHPDAGQTCWLNYVNRPAPFTDPIRYETGWYTGTAGIGIFLLELHDALRGVAQPGDLTPANP